MEQSLVCAGQFAPSSPSLPPFIDTVMSSQVLDWTHYQPHHCTLHPRLRQYSVVQYSIVQYGVVQYNVFHCSAVQCRTVQCSA